MIYCTLNMFIKLGGAILGKRYYKPLMALAGVVVLLSGCGNSEAGALEKDTKYVGRGATEEIIEVKSDSSWKIKSKNEDDSNYNMVSVTDTGEKLAEYPAIELKITEKSGDIESSFGREEGRDFIYLEDEDVIYFCAFSEDSKEEITKRLEEASDPDEEFKDMSTFTFDES